MAERSNGIHKCPEVPSPELTGQSWVEIDGESKSRLRLPAFGGFSLLVGRCSVHGEWLKEGGQES
jgi:hypothetical protein